ncbi:UNVERIFIED_CONTAM: hypothetical protein PYX00_001618 [Menopon gallinae]|uniref:PHR domain-containing protein n=1 Tax=Menopon gallinae TaxID=328185 RepID=A0AAW2IF30_9NEOP
MLPEVSALGNAFHELFKIPAENLKSKTDWSRKRKRKWESYAKKKGREGIDAKVGPPEIELPGNASKFAVFANVRQAVLEAWTRKATQTFLNSCASIPTQDNTYEGDSDSDATEIYHPPPRVPKIVGVGLRCVLELIKESRTSNPLFCTRALSALLDVLQGQQPQGLQGEPADVMDPLFDLLLDLATTNGVECKTPDDGNHLTAIACSCLLSLVVVRGSTGKLLAAAAALLMSPKQIANQNVQLPLVMTALQRSLHAVLLGKISRPDWITHGIPNQSRVDTFKIGNAENLGIVRSLASDGQFLYVYSSRGLFKIGSGYSGTIKGHIYNNVPDFFHDEKGWLGYANGWLWLKLSGKKGCELLRIDRDPFRVVDATRLDVRDWGPGVWFSDGDQLGVISALREDGFFVRTLNTNVKPVTVTSELTLKLARKCIDVLGVSSYDEENPGKTLNIGSDDEIVSITAGKEFGLVRTLNGKVLYSGKANSLGLKSGGSGGRWAELTIPKGPRAQHIAVGHEGLHAVIVTEDGAAFFCGTARRGEDGDISKARRQPKAVKPKKVVKVESEFIVHAAANNGTTALVTRDGQLLMFGKDTVHCNTSTGQVTELKDLQVTQVALGKAHAVALTTKGIVYTFGINNKGQCGRDFTAQLKEAPPLVVAMETTGPEEEKEDELDWEEVQEGICTAGKHQWRYDQCMVCTICRECTGYGNSCLSSMRNAQRNPGQECGCGEGDSGCSVCGCCRVCARENVDNSDLALLGPSGAGDLAGMMRLDLMFGSENQGGKHAVKLQDHLQRRLEERRQRQSRKITSKHYCGLKMKNSCMRTIQNSTKVASQPPIFRTPPSMKFSNLINEEQAAGSDVERDASRIVSLPPAPVALPYTSPVVQIACGLHHTVVLTQSGEVYTFGSNIYGQLGVGDVLLRGGPVNVSIPVPAQSVAAGSNHTVVLTVKGEVFTFGSYQKGQLGRKCTNGISEMATTSSSSRKLNSCRDGPWYAVPAPVPGIGARFGRRATWIGAAADQTFIKVDESLINSLSLEKATVTGNKTSVLLIPSSDCSSFESLAISRRDGGCAIFSGPNQIRLTGSPICLDPLYNVLWSYHASSDTISCHNIVASEAKTLDALSHSMFDPDLILPVNAGCLVKRSQAALHLLGALDTLSQAQLQKIEIGSEVIEKQVGPTKAYTLQDFLAVNRFENHGGGWGYSGHSVEAIRFMADADIILGGFGLFGGRGEYTAKIKLLDIGVDGGEHEVDGDIVAETEDIPYECGPRQKYPMMFEEPILLQANRWYVAWARISGPSSDCGSNGQGTITTEDQITFYFKSSKKSNNGTDVNAGQIPQLLYRGVTQETKAPPRQMDQAEPIYVLTKEFSSAVTKECFQSLLALLQWGWMSLKAGCVDTHSSTSLMSSYVEQERLSRLVFINRVCLRLLHLYTNEIYPNQIAGRKAVAESVRLAECIGDVRALLRQILSDKPITGPHKGMVESVLEECHKTFVLIFHALYPTPFLKWTCLCELLSKVDKSALHYTQQDRLLSAVLAALCGPTIRLRSTLPVLSDNLEPTLRQLSPSDNSGLTTSGTEHHYPLLVEQMSYRTQLERSGEGNNGWGWREVLERLLDLATLPVKKALSQRPSKLSNDLITNCCHLLARVIAELASQSNGSDEDLQASCGRVLHTTPSRFMRTNQTRTWNTGKGSPDAICFTVDRPGIVIAGVCVYGGIGMYEYELELLDDVCIFQYDGAYINFSICYRNNWEFHSRAHQAEIPPRPNAGPV